MVIKPSKPTENIFFSQDEIGCYVPGECEGANALTVLQARSINECLFDCQVHTHIWRIPLKINLFKCLNLNHRISRPLTALSALSSLTSWTKRFKVEFCILFRFFSPVRSCVGRSLINLTAMGAKVRKGFFFARDKGRNSFFL